jgi:hypothetical protein
VPWQGAWRALPHGGDGQAVLARELLSLIPSLAPYGEAASELVTLLKWLLADTGGGERRASAGSSSAMQHTYGRGPSSRSSSSTTGDRGEGRGGGVLSTVVTEEVLEGVVEALKTQNAVLANHPNSAIYGALQNLIEMDGCAALQRESPSGEKKRPTRKGLEFGSCSSAASHALSSGEWEDHRSHHAAKERTNWWQKALARRVQSSLPQQDEDPPPKHPGIHARGEGC